MKKGWEVWGYAVRIDDLRFGIKDLYRLGKKSSNKLTVYL